MIRFNKFNSTGSNDYIQEFSIFALNKIEYQMRIKALLLLFSLLWSSSLFSQIEVAPIKQKPKWYELSSSDYETFKASKTIFVIRDQDVENSSIIKNILDEVWTFTKYEILTYSEILSSGLYKDTSCSFFTIGGRVSVRVDGNTMKYKVYVYFNLWRNAVYDWGVKYMQQLARIELSPSHETTMFFVQNAASLPGSALGYYGGPAEFGEGVLMDHLYKSAVLYNYNWPQIRNSLQTTDSLLNEGKSHTLVPEDFSTIEVTKLKDHTLYIPDYSLIQLDFITRAEIGPIDLQKLLRYYPYPVSVVTVEQLNLLMKGQDQPIYYLMFVRSYATKLIWVVNSQNGSIVFFRSADGHQLRDLDMNALAKAVAGKKWTR